MPKAPPQSSKEHQVAWPFNSKHNPTGTGLKIIAKVAHETASVCENNWNFFGADSFVHPVQVKLRDLKIEA
jgi:hypothetical protein